MKVLVTAGGGGHFAAALSVMQAMPNEWEVVFVGRKYTFEGDTTESFEIRTVRKLGISYRVLDSGRLQRSFSPQTITSLLKLPKGLLQAQRILRDTRPDVVIGFGGYITVPLIFAASRMGIPSIIHEQVLKAGLANKIAKRFVKAVCISWEESKKYFPYTSIILTGNPVKKEIQDVSVLSQDKIWEYLQEQIGLKKNTKPLLYITGGSGGSHFLNTVVERNLNTLLEKYVIVHQTGDAKQFQDFDRLTEIKSRFSEELQKHYFIGKFFTVEEFAFLLKGADLVIGRSGIGTISELLYLEKKALSIPLTLSRLSEQLDNAVFYKRLGLGNYIRQEELTDELFLEKIDELLKKDETLSDAAKSYHKLFLNAADTIVSTISTYANTTKANTET